VHIEEMDDKESYVLDDDLRYQMLSKKSKLRYQEELEKIMSE
jgi:hypothetical protein